MVSKLYQDTFKVPQTQHDPNKIDFNQALDQVKHLISAASNKSTNSTTFKQKSQLDSQKM